jgi:hypothetical protein
MSCGDERHVLKHHDSLGTIWHECDCGFRRSFDMAPEGLCSKCDGTCIRCGSSPARHHKVEDDNGTVHRVCDECFRKDLLLVARLNGEFDLTIPETSAICLPTGIAAHFLLRWYVGPLSSVAEGIIDFVVMGSAVFIAQHFALARLWRRHETLAEQKARQTEQSELERRKQMWQG